MIQPSTSGHWYSCQALLKVAKLPIAFLACAAQTRDRCHIWVTMDKRAPQSISVCSKKCIAMGMRASPGSSEQVE